MHIVIIEGHNDLREIYEGAAADACPNSTVTVFDTIDAAKKTLPEASVVVIDYYLPGAASLAKRLEKQKAMLITTANTSVAEAFSSAYLKPGFDKMRELLSVICKAGLGAQD
jgi:DNA-binding NtrC family response regulator